MLRLFRLAVATCTAVILVQGGVASTPPTFSAPETLNITAPAYNMVMGDFDGDGIPDLAVYGGDYDANFNPFGSVEVLFGNGAGGFRSSFARFKISISSSGYEGIAAADLNGDGKSELIFAVGDAVLVYDWTGSGFSQTRSIGLSATRINAAKVAVGDMTARGSRDILMSDDFGAVGVVWVPNDGKGHYGAPTAFPAGGVVFQPLLADVNGDGLADVILPGIHSAGGMNDLVGVLLNNGSGALGAEAYYASAALSAAASNSLMYVVSGTVADVDGDGKADLVCACFLKDLTTFEATFYLTVNLGNGDGTFKDGMAFPFDSGNPKYGINAIAAADLNGDGTMDIVTVDEAQSGFTVTGWSGTGDALAIERQDHFQATGPYFSSVTLGYTGANGEFVTFDNDANIDALLGTTSSVFISNNVTHYGVVVFTNTSGAPALNTLPATTVQIIGTIAPGAAIHFSASQSSVVPGIYVRIQYSTTPKVESSWTDLPGGGHLLLSEAGTYTFGTAGTASYLAGKGVYFRAITAALGYTDSISSPIGPYTLAQANLIIGAKETSTSDPTGKLHVVHLGDTLTYNFTWTNIGNATAHDLIVQTPVPTYQDATTDIQNQFARTALTFNQYGHYVPESSAGAGDAQVWWNVADLPPGAHQSVTLGVQVGPSVRLQQAIGLPNSYQVYSSISEPPTAATGYSSGAPNIGATVAGPLQLTITPDVTTVAPGGLVNYTITIQNSGAFTATNVVIADPVPAFASFVGATFVNAKGAVVASPAFKVNVAGKSVAVNNPLRLMGLYPSNSLPAPEQTFLAANPLITMPSDFNDEIVFYVGNLAKGASASVRLTVQADFIGASSITDQEIKNFDYLGYLSDSTGAVLVSKNESGNISTPVTGPLQNAPNLSLAKSAPPGSLTPGDTFTIWLLGHNSGASEADSVFFQDSLPSGGDNAVLPLLVDGSGKPITANSTQQQLNSAIVFIPTTGGGPSMESSRTNYFVTLDPGNVLTVHGLRLDPNATVAVGYAMQVPATTPVPESLVAGTSFIGAGNGSESIYGTGTSTVTNTVPPGTPLSSPMDIVGNAQLFTPTTPFQPVITPMVTTDPAATASQLDAMFKKNPNASLTVINSKGVPVFIPGIYRYIFHYQNTGTNAASDVHLLFTTPANTEFYRASFWSNGIVIPNANGQSISEPLKLGSGDVSFNIGTLAPTNGGYCMVDVILESGAINATSSRAPAPSPLLYSGVRPQTARPMATDSGNDGNVIYDGHYVPKVGVLKVVPQAVQQGGNFDVQFAIINWGTNDLTDACDVVMQAPAGTQIVGIDASQGFIQSSNATSCDVKFYPIVFGHRTATGLTITLQVTGSVGSMIEEDSISAIFPYSGTFKPKATEIKIVSAQPANSTITTVSGVQFLTLGEMCVIPMGPDDYGYGLALVSGPTALFSPANLSGSSLGASRIAGSDNGNSIYWGQASAISLIELPVLANTDTKTLLANLPKIVGQQGANIFNGPQDNLIGSDGETLLDNNTGGVATTIKALLATGGRSVIASGSGVVLSSSLTGAATVGGGLISTTTGGNVMTAGGGAVANDAKAKIAAASATLIGNSGSTLIGNSGSTIISQDGNGVVSNDGGSLQSSVQSAAMIQTPGGNIVAAGGGNIVAAGGGN